MSDKETPAEKRAKGCGALFGRLMVFSLFFGLTGQVLKWCGQLEADWQVLWVPAIVLYSLAFLLFAFIGFMHATEKSQ